MRKKLAKEFKVSDESKAAATQLHKEGYCVESSLAGVSEMSEIIEEKTKVLKLQNIRSRIMSKKYYLFLRASTNETHACETVNAPSGEFELDQIFGGGFVILCGDPAEGEGVISNELMTTRHVNCAKCKIVLAEREQEEMKKDAKEEWPPPVVFKAARPEIQMIQGEILNDNK